MVKEEKRQRYDNVPYGDVMPRLIELTFPADHPYGHSTIGSMEDLDAATLEDVRSFFATHYLPNNAVLTLAGDVDPETAFAKAATYFGSLPRGAEPADPDETPLPPLAGDPRQETSADVPAHAVYLTWRLPATGSTDRRSTRSTSPSPCWAAARRPACTGRWSATWSWPSPPSASTMGLIGGNSFGFAYARARDQVSPEQLEEALITEIDRLANDGPTADRVASGQGPVRAALAARAGPDRLPSRRHG